MKITSYGRIVIALMWYDAATWQTLGQIWKLPFGTTIGGCLMALQIAGGIGMQFPRTVRAGSMMLCVVYFCFSLACIPDIIAASSLYERYGGSFFQQLSLLCGAIALYATTKASAASAVVLGRYMKPSMEVVSMRRLRRVRRAPQRSADWRVLDSESVPFHLR